MKNNFKNSKSQKITGLWERKDKNGNSYMTGTCPDGKKYEIRKIQSPKKWNSPDYVLYVNEKKESAAINDIATFETDQPVHEQNVRHSVDSPDETIVADYKVRLMNEFSIEEHFKRFFQRDSGTAKTETKTGRIGLLNMLKNACSITFSLPKWAKLF